MSRKPIRHCSCTKALDPRNTTGKCRSCFFRASATDPALIAKRSKSLRLYHDSLKFRNLMRQASLTRIAWCPVEYRDEYRHLIYNKHIKAAEARGIIERLIATDAARYAATGQLQQARRYTA